MKLVQNQEYKDWLIDLKRRIKGSQLKAAASVNSELIMMYWDLGRQIVEKQQSTKWGSGFMDQLSKDLMTEFSEMGGFSRSNLFAIRKFYLFYSQSISIVHQPVGQLKKQTVHLVGGLLKTEEEQNSNAHNHLEILTLCCQLPWIKK